MPFTRKRGIARLLVMVLDVDQIPDFAPWSYDGVHYDLEVEVEKVPQNEPNDDDILMADGEDRDKDHEDANDQHSDQPRDNTNPPASSNKEKPLIGGASSTSKLPMETLRFGSFDVTSTPYNLGSAFVQKEADEQAPFVSIQRSVSTSKLELSTHMISQENRKASSAVPLARRAEPLHMLEHDNTQEACCQTSPTSPIARDVPLIMRDSKQEASRPPTPVSSHSFSNSKQQVISSKYDKLVEETTSDQHFDSVVTGKTHNEITNDDVISFGGIPGPTSCDRRFSQRIQEKPDADDMLMGRAMRAAKLRDAETTSGLSIDQTASILNLSDSEILNNASDIGVSMGTSSKNIAKSINDILDLEVDRTIEFIKNLAAVKPMNDSDINDLGGAGLQTLCDSIFHIDGEVDDVDDMGLEGYMAPSDAENHSQPLDTHNDLKSVHEKTRRPWKRKVYPESAVRSARVKQKKKFHDEL